MGKPAKKLTSEEQLYAAALRALARRGHSVWEMRQALERRSDEKGRVRPVLERLKNERLLDDARYARQFARQRAESRRQGRYRIARELRARGVADRHIEAALDEVFSETDEAELVRQRLARRLRLRQGPLDTRQLASLYRALLRSGFSAELIRRELRALRGRSVPRLPEAEAEESANGSE